MEQTVSHVRARGRSSSKPARSCGSSTTSQRWPRSGKPPATTTDLRAARAAAEDAPLRTMRRPSRRLRPGNLLPLIWNDCVKWAHVSSNIRQRPTDVAEQPSQWPEGCVGDVSAATVWPRRRRRRWALRRRLTLISGDYSAEQSSAHMVVIRREAVQSRRARVRTES